MSHEIDHETQNFRFSSSAYKPSTINYKRVVGLVSCVICLETSVCYADVLHLKNGNDVEGIIVDQTNEEVVLKFNIGARITFSSEEIEFIERSSPEENKTLEALWMKERYQREKEEEARRKFEAEQRRKGLVEYRGRWVTSEEKEKLETDSLLNEILDEKTKRGEIVKRGDEGRSALAKILLVKESWYHKQTQHFIVYCQDLMQGKVVADKVEYWREKIAYDLNYEKGLSWGDKCEVFVIPDKDRWEQLLSEVHINLDLVGGFFAPNEPGEIFLCALSIPYLSVTFPHELTHLIFGDFAGGKHIPLWLNEGLANYESGMTSYANERLQESIKSGEYISLKRLVELKYYPREEKEMELYYAESEKIVEFLVTQHGRGSFADFSKAIIDGKPFENAIREVYGANYGSMEDFNKAWIKYIIK